LVGSYLKNRILVQKYGGRPYQTGGMLKYFEDLIQVPNTEFGPKDTFSMAYSKAVYTPPNSL
jgi:hypothetical protein